MAIQDREIGKLIEAEIERQQETINLIPSENYVSPDLLKVIGSPLTNKYSEGYAGKRYYPGNQYYDEIEVLAQERALKAFGLAKDQWRANVQPYSGSPANLEIYGALMEPGETLMGMRLSAGGHLTHGHKVSFTGKFFKSVQFGVDEKTELIDYEAAAALAREHKPKVLVSGFTAYPRLIDFKKFGEIAKEVGAYHVADISHIAGLVLADAHPSPFPYADAVMMTTHKTLRGPRGAVIISRLAPLKSGAEGMIADAIDKAVFPGMQGGPHNNVTAAIAAMFFEAGQPGFKEYQAQIVANAKELAGELIELGFRLVAGGTDNHLLLLDVRGFGIDGMTAQKLLDQNNITANRNTIPGDTSPFKPSGVRIGTPAVTTRGMKGPEMERIAHLIHRALVDKADIKKEVIALCKKFPLPY